ncbi:omega-conotoxin-like protein 1 [Leptopilina heterotoma]|uniref:omega-conotoxin-like protein 1 n=1 Tax=Leptopilina heterotoma TaxID=63436 RepID=UPI001CA87F3A|nr:omega-conotoxin-like protein 1 [Leptopilina heterotoma]
MSKFILLTIVFCLTVTIISSRSTNRQDSTVGMRCGRHGDPCVSSEQCCSNVKMTCHRYANRCQVVITEEELRAGRANLKKTGHKLFK